MGTRGGHHTWLRVRQQLRGIARNTSDMLQNPHTTPATNMPAEEVAPTSVSLLNVTPSAGQTPTTCSQATTPVQAQVDTPL